MTTPKGEVVSTTDVEMGSVHDGNTNAIRIMIPDQLALGDYLVSLDLIDEATGATGRLFPPPMLRSMSRGTARRSRAACWPGTRPCHEAKG